MAPGGGAMGSKSHSPAKVPGSALLGHAAGRRRPSSGRCPGWCRPASPRPSTTVSTSSVKPSQSSGRSGGTTEAPWARKSSAHRSRPGARAAAIGSHTAPWRPVAWAQERRPAGPAQLVDGERVALGGRDLAHRDQGAFGRPRMRSPMMFFCTWVVPPAMRPPGAPEEAGAGVAPQHGVGAGQVGLEHGEVEQQLGDAELGQRARATVATAPWRCAQVLERPASGEEGHEPVALDAARGRRWLASWSSRRRSEIPAAPM